MLCTWCEGDWGSEYWRLGTRKSFERVSAVSYESRPLAWISGWRQVAAAHGEAPNGSSCCVKVTFPPGHSHADRFYPSRKPDDDE